MSQNTAQEMYNLGNNYYYGRNGFEKNYTKAAEYFEKAALMGYASAQADLGLCYDNGLGVPQNYAKAVEWYTKAANQGNMYAQRNLALSYKNGQGVRAVRKGSLPGLRRRTAQSGSLLRIRSGRDEGFQKSVRVV